MKKVSVHKPGTSAALRYKYSSISSTWIPEAYFQDLGWCVDNAVTYRGAVAYVVF